MNRRLNEHLSIRKSIERKICWGDSFQTTTATTATTTFVSTHNRHESRPEQRTKVWVIAKAPSIASRPRSCDQHIDVKGFVFPGEIKPTPVSKPSVDNQVVLFQFETFNFASPGKETTRYEDNERLSPNYCISHNSTTLLFSFTRDGKGKQEDGRN